MAIAFTDESAKQAIRSGQPVVIDFWAPWCGPCRMLGPIVEEIAAAYDGRVLVGKYDVDEGEELPMEFGVRNIPTVLFFKDGQLVNRTVGTMTRDQFAAHVNALL